MRRTRRRASGDLHLAELEAIKRLLVLLALRDGATQGEVGKVLGKPQSEVSRMFSKPIGRQKRNASATR